jgi:phospholipid/cholesterol/gamma-HCH transport system ATP-binding protein
VIVTHDILSARRVGEYVVLIWKGKVVEEGPAEHLFDSANPFTKQFFAGEAQGPLGME